MSKDDKKSFFVGLAIVTLIMAVLAFAGDALGFYRLHPHTWWALAYNLILSIASYLIIKKGLAGSNYAFYNAFIGNTTLRLLLSAVLFLVYFLNFKENRLGFVIAFFTFYFIYTIFEIKSLLSNLRTNSQRVENKDEK